MIQTRSAKAQSTATGARPSVAGTSIALIAVFAALLAAFSLIPGFMIGPVPFSMTIIIVLLTPLLLGARQGFLAVALYIAAGVVGLPVFAGGASGIAVLAGPTGGYLVGYLLCALVAGTLATLVLRQRSSGTVTLIGLTIVAVVELAFLHAAGVGGLMLNADMSFGAAVGVTMGFVPLDLVKAVLAAIIAVAVFRAFPRIPGHRRA